MKPGLYDIAPGVYYADALSEEPSLNASVIKELLKHSPLHAWTAHPKLNPNYREKVSSAFDLGTVAHALFLQGEQITSEEIAFTVDDKDVRTALLVRVDAKPFALVTDAADWRTKAAKQVRDEARRRGIVPLLEDQWNAVPVLVSEIRRQLPAIDTLGLPGLFVAGKAERTLVWRDRGVLCRARMDWLHDSLECVDDMKSTARSAEPNHWSRSVFSDIGADIQAAFTLRGLRAACGVESTFRFLLAEVDEPYAIAAVTPSPQSLEFANRRIDVALDRWKRCLADDEWPSYAPHVLTIDPPPWAETQWAEMQSLEQEVAAA